MTMKNFAKYFSYVTSCHPHNSPVVESHDPYTAGKQMRPGAPEQGAQCIYAIVVTAGCPSPLPHDMRKHIPFVLGDPALVTAGYAAWWEALFFSLLEVVLNGFLAHESYYFLTL